MHQWMITGLLFVLGLALGSFGNVIIARFPEEKSLAGRSACPRCGKTLSPLELIPVASFLFLCARCRGCGRPISWRYPLIELATAFLFVFALPLTSFALFPACALAIVFWVMLLIAVIDYDTQFIPDALTILLIVVTVAYHLLAGMSLMVEGAIIGGVFFGVQWLISGGRWIGSGDIFLAVALGILLGSWQLMVAALMASYILGMVAAVILLMRRRASKHSHIAFGPFLIAGAFITFVAGDALLEWMLLA